MTTIVKPKFLTEKPAKAVEAAPPSRASLVASLKLADSTLAEKLPALEADAKAKRERHAALNAEAIAARDAAVAAEQAIRAAHAECRAAKDRTERLLRETCSPLIAEMRKAIEAVESDLRLQTFGAEIDRAFAATGEGRHNPVKVDHSVLPRVLSAARDELARIEVSDLEGVALRNRLALIWQRVEVAAGRAGD